jgi:hypothetical protein
MTAIRELIGLQHPPLRRRYSLRDMIQRRLPRADERYIARTAENVAAVKVDIRGDFPAAQVGCSA